MYTYGPICMYVHIWTNMYIYGQICTHMDQYVCTHTDKYVCTHTCGQICMYIHTHMDKYVHIWTNMYTYGQICTHIDKYVHICTNMYTYGQICTKNSYKSVKNESYQIVMNICKPNLAYFTISSKKTQNDCENTCPVKLHILIKRNKNVKYGSYKYL
jgi:hypothetical protein